MATFTIQGQLRTESGKGAARQLRRDKMIPAVVYGGKEEPQKLSLTDHSVMMARQQGGFFTNMQEIEIDGKTIKVLPREIQKNPKTDKVQHVDFLRYDANRKIKVMVRVSVSGEENSPGVKKGGVISLVRNEIELLCKADSIPNSLVIAIDELDIGHAAKMSEITLPAGVEPVLSDRDFTVVTILSTRTSTVAEDDAADAANAAEAAEETATEE